MMFEFSNLDFIIWIRIKFVYIRHSNLGLKFVHYFT